MTIKSLFAFLVFIFFTLQLNAQSDSLKVKLELEDVIMLAIEQAPAIKYHQNRNVNYYWRFKNFKANFRPMLGLTGNIPTYEFENIPVTQPDGSIAFRQIQQLNTNAQLALTQVIPQFGTQIYGASTMFRTQDFIQDTVKWAGTPFKIGFVQPLFAYNWYKWAQRTEPLIYEEANRYFIESVEQISLNTAVRFFNYLRIQTNFNLASSNLKNSEDNLKIAEVKRKLGQISENDFSRIQLSVLNAKKALNSADMDLRNADFELKSYIGMDQTTKIELVIPLNMTLYFIDPEKALEQTIANRKEAPQFERRLIMAERDLTQAKRNTGLRTTLRGEIGTTKSSGSFGGIYEETEKQRMVNLSLNIPILDWGKSASAVKLAESQRDLVLYEVEREKLNFEREVIVQVEQFNLLKDQLETSMEADKVAENGYLISLKKFQNGEISITDLNISLAERESAKRDYISSIRDYWQSYYNIRMLTLYDFVFSQKINYTNPSLSNR